MRALPEEFEVDALIGALADGWGFEVDSLDYAAVGGGSYHWVIRDLEGRLGFVTVDDLDVKPWLGDTRESTFEGLKGAFDAAVALRDSGLDFVVAPLLTGGGDTVRRVGPRYAIALFPFVAGQAGEFDRYETAERAAILTMLAELHQATPVGGFRRTHRRPDSSGQGRARISAPGAESDVVGRTLVRARAANPRAPCLRGGGAALVVRPSRRGRRAPK